MSAPVPHSPEAAACVAAVAVSGHLTDADREALAEAIRLGWHDGGMYGRADLHPRWLDGIASVTSADILPAVEAIVARAVNEALTEAADAIQASEVVGNDLLDTEIGRNEGYRDAAALVRARIT